MSRYGQGRGGRPWRRKVEGIKARDGHLCQACKRKGRFTLGTECDHIVPLSKGGTDDESNLQLLCSTCHEAKTLRESGARPIVGCDADGWPT